jgi:hypothetical protein
VRTKPTPEKKSAFLDALAESGNVSLASGAVGIDRRAVYEWRAVDPDFAERWEAAKALGIEACEDEIRRRAFAGYDEPLSKDGKLTGDVVRKYSDTLAIFLLKGAKPEVYKDRVANELSGPNGAPIAVDDHAAADRLAAIIAAAASRKTSDGSDLA